MPRFVRGYSDSAQNNIIHTFLFQSLFSTTSKEYVDVFSTSFNIEELGFYKISLCFEWKSENLLKNFSYTLHLNSDIAIEHSLNSNLKELKSDIVKYKTQSFYFFIKIEENFNILKFLIKSNESNCLNSINVRNAFLEIIKV